MNNFWLLVKTNFKMTFINKLLKKMSKKGPLIIGLVLLLIGLCAMIFASIYIAIFAMLLNKGNKPELILLLSLIMCFILCIISNIFRSNSYLFRTKDFDMLMSMPIKPRDIILSKMVSLMILNYLFVLLIYVPTQVIYAFLVPTDIMFWVFSFFAYFFVPLVPVVIASFIAYAFGFIPLSLKIKNILSIVISIVFLVGVVSINFIMDSNLENEIEFVNKIERLIYNPYFITTYIYEGIRGNILYYLLFISTSIIIFALFVLIIDKTFIKANASNKINIMSKKFVLKENYNSQRKSLIVKELKRYVTIPGYLMNTIAGPIVSIIFVVVLIVQKNKILSEDSVPINTMMPIILMAIITFFVGMTTTTCSSISLEGKSLWILKSFPISTKEVFVSKIAINILITIPFIIVDSIVGAVALRLDPLVCLFIILIPTLFTITMSITGLLINLLFPKLDFDQPIIVIKQSLSVFLSMLTCFILLLIAAVIGFVVGILISITIAYIAVTLTMICFLIISILLLKKIGTRKYEALNC